jgi:hypothetical protein
MATNNHQHILNLYRCSKPSSRRQPPRVTKNPHPQRSPSATRCNHTRKCTWNHSISLWIHSQAREIVGRSLFSSQWCQECQMSKSEAMELTPSIYRASQRNRVVALFVGWPDATTGRCPASGLVSPVTRWSLCIAPLNIVRSILTVISQLRDHLSNDRTHCLTNRTLNHRESDRV